MIKLNATDSTNEYLKGLVLSTSLTDYTVVVAKKQLKGRGQMGTIWESEMGKNLTFSVLKKWKELPVKNAFMLNICVSLAIYRTLKQLHIPDLHVKWPNDILSGTHKICGILIENILAGHQIQTCIIGIGLNVNQIKFPTLSKVSSLKSLVGTTFHLEELLQAILEQIKKEFISLNKVSYLEKQNEYEKVLFRKDKPSTFQQNETLFMGFIRGISPQGKLRIELEDAVFKEFDLKEIKLLY